MQVARNVFDNLVTIENLMLAWKCFKRGKQQREDVQYFERYREDFIYKLHKDLRTDQYQHDGYAHFYTFDPQKRFLSKACVRDRLVHQMLYADLAMVFEKIFIFHSFSCIVVLSLTTKEPSLTRSKTESRVALYSALHNSL